MKNKTILITGGSSGIGLATAKKYAEQQANIIIVGKTEDRLIDAAKEIGKNVTYYMADISKTASLHDLYKKLKAKSIEIDVLIASAGLGKFGSVEEVSEEVYDLVMDTNTKGTFFTVSTLKPILKKGGHIVLISSFLAHKSLPLTSVLSASKVAVETFTKIFAREFSDDQIKVNAISPGSIKSNFMKVVGISEEQQKNLSLNMPKIPLGKRGDAAQIADVILFLTSPGASYINGTVLSVDGGISIA